MTDKKKIEKKQNNSEDNKIPKQGITRVFSNLAKLWRKWDKKRGSKRDSL